MPARTRARASTASRCAGRTSSRRTPSRTRRRSRCSTTAATTRRRSTWRSKAADYAGFEAAQGRQPRSAASCAASASRPTSRRAASRRRPWSARSARAPACTRRPRCACIRPAASRCSPARTATARATRRPSRSSSPTRLGVPIEQVEIVHGDTDQIPFGMGTYGSRSLAVGGTAIVKAMDKIIAKGKKIAAHLLEAAEADIEFEDGKFTRRRHRPREDVRRDRARRLRAAQLPARRARAGARRDRVLRSEELHLPRRAATSARSRSTPRPASSRSSSFAAVDDFGSDHQPDDRRGPGARRRSRRASARRCCEDCVYDERRASSLTGSYHGLRDAARRRPADLQGRQPTSRRARTTRSA